MTHQVPMKKLARYCCQGCGAKELFLYCWKGCRQIQNLKAFYSETKAVCQEMQTLKAAVYAQERRIHDLEGLATEKQQSLDVLTNHIKLLSRSATLPAVVEGDSLSDANSQLLSNLPAWSEAAIGLVMDKFDVDKDGLLNEEEFEAIEALLKEKQSSLKLVEKTRGNKSIDSASILRYYSRVGVDHFTNDLQILGIPFGSTPTQSSDVMLSIEMLDVFAGQVKDLKNEIEVLKEEVKDKARTTTRLREGFAEVQMALDGKDSEIQRVHQHRCHVNMELEQAKTAMISVTGDLKKAKEELAIKTSALHDLRALVEDQVHEKEKWQKYCWELEERLYDAVHTSHTKERDLWKARDARKEEARKNMLLYIDRGMGKKHYDVVNANTPTSIATYNDDDVETNTSWYSDGRIEGVDYVTGAETSFSS